MSYPFSICFYKSWTSVTFIPLTVTLDVFRGKYVSSLRQVKEQAMYLIHFFQPVVL